MSRTFDAVDDYIQCPLFSTKTTNVSFGGWFLSPNATYSRGTCCGTGSATTGYFLAFGSSDGSGTGNIMVLIANVAWKNFSVGWTSGIWQHYFLVQEGSTNWRLYRNGFSVATVTGSTAVTPSGASFLGGEDATSTTDWNGSLAHFHHYDTILSAGEIRQIMLYPGSIRRALKAYLPCYGLNSPEPDYSGLKNDGTVSGAVKGSTEPKINRIFQVHKPELITSF